jgi:Hypervirulence associated proteins TUDOR domain
VLYTGRGTEIASEDKEKRGKAERPSRNDPPKEFDMPTLSKGDKVQWQTSQGRTEGTVTRKVSGTAKAGGHIAKASPEHPQYEVASSKSGKTAIHKASALKKVR